MALKTVLDNFAKAQNEYETKAKELGTKAQQEIATAIAAVMPDGHVFVWTQSTPYFNDGDPCVFHVGTGYVITDEQYENDDDFYEGTEIYGKQRGELADLGTLWAKLESKSSEALMLAAFGDHAKIIVMKDGTYKRSSYTEHD